MAQEKVTRLSGLLVALSLVLHQAPAGADGACLKQVFGRYCLGADVNQVLASMPPPIMRQARDDSLALVFQEGADRLYLLAYTNRLYKVVRAFAVATQLRFDDTYKELVQLYGAGQDASRFPVYASTPTARLASIRRGEGRAVHRWEPSPDWHIELSWTQELGVSLAYVATELEARRSAKAEGGL